MAVPNTNTFSLQDVVTELGITSNKSLTNCFAQASSFAFDPNYQELKDQLDDFRNYNGIPSALPTKSYTLSFSGSSQSSGACSLSTSVTRTVYFKSNASSPITGDVLYQNSSATVVFNGSGNWYRGAFDNNFYQIQTNGSISTKGFCP